MKRFTILLALVALVAVSGLAIVAQDDSLTTAGPITERVLDRGALSCGVSGTLAGFSFVDDSGDYTGFDVDLCRAVSAAILGDADAVNFRNVIAADRQAAMQGGEIDLMVRNTTWTISRDVTWTSIFGPVTFYDGQGVMTLNEYGVSNFAELADLFASEGQELAVCVQAGTTTELNISDFRDANGYEFEIPTYADNVATQEAYYAGACAAMTTDKSGLASIRANAEDPGAHLILPETLSKEPLGPLSPQEDPQFAEVVAWVTFGVIQAEEFGISSENIADFLPADGEEDDAYTDRVGANIARFLGQANSTSGDFLGIPNDFMVAVISQVGNYGEIYERNLVPLGLERAGSLNALWTEGGLLYAPPFR